MIRVKQIGSNMTVMYRDGNEILFSYETPVAVYDDKYAKCIRTEQKYSRTTSRHIAKWLNGANCETVPQHVINEFVM